MFSIFGYFFQIFLGSKKISHCDGLGIATRRWFIFVFLGSTATATVTMIFIHGFAREVFVAVLFLFGVLSVPQNKLPFTRGGLCTFHETGRSRMLWKMSLWATFMIFMERMERLFNNKGKVRVGIPFR